MDLHIIKVFKPDPMFFCNPDCIPGQMRIICGMLIEAADPAASQNGVRRPDQESVPVHVLRRNPGALSVFYNNIRH